MYLAAQCILVVSNGNVEFELLGIELPASQVVLYSVRLEI